MVLLDRPLAPVEGFRVALGGPGGAGAGRLAWKLEGGGGPGARLPPPPTGNPEKPGNTPWILGGWDGTLPSLSQIWSPWVSW